MEEAEAEAVLMALGLPPLEWTDFNGLILSNYVVNNVDGQEERYEIASNHRGTRFYTQCAWGGFDDIRNFATLATEEDAKLACERHYTTGKWE